MVLANIAQRKWAKNSGQERLSLNSLWINLFHAVKQKLVLVIFVCSCIFSSVYFSGISQTSFRNNNSNSDGNDIYTKKGKEEYNN